MEFLETISVEDYQKLHLEVGWKYLDNKVIEKSLANSTFIVSVREMGETIGMGRIVGDGIAHGLLTDVIVSPKWQHKGIGKAIVENLKNRLQDFVNSNGDEYLLELLPTANNVEFYTRCGFKHLPENMEGCYKWFKNQNIYNKETQKHIMRLQKAPFENIKNKTKTIEMRLNDEKRSHIKKGDIIIFLLQENYEQAIKTRVKEIHKFKDFEELYMQFDKTQIGYKESEEANPHDMEQYYNKAQIDKYGVVGIEIEVLD